MTTAKDHQTERNCHSNGFVPYDESVLGSIVPKQGRKLIYLLFVDVTAAQPTGNVMHLFLTTVKFSASMEEQI